MQHQVTRRQTLHLNKQAANQHINALPSCNIRRFSTYRALNQHLRTCLKKPSQQIDVVTLSQPVPNIQQNNETSNENEATDYSNTLKWGEVPLHEFTGAVNNTYEKIVFWKKNLFLLPSGSAGKAYIEEITKLMNAWSDDSYLADIAFKAIHIMPALLLQKPSKDSKSKDHTKALTQRLELWKKGDIEELIFEGATIQNRLKNVNTLKTIAAVSKKFATLMEKGNVNGALKLLTNNMANGILPLNNQTLNLLHLKHPEAKEVSADVLIQGPKPRIHPVIFDEIDEDLIKMKI